jgi:hypothetical protein
MVDDNTPGSSGTRAVPSLSDHMTPELIRKFALRYVLYILLLSILSPLLFTVFFAKGISVMGRLFETNTPAITRSFELSKESAHPLNARITIINSSLLNPDGSGPERHLDFDALGVFWSPCAFMMSLFLASPFPWKRRFLYILVGIPLMLCASYLQVRFLIWDESSYIGLVWISPEWRELVTVLRGISNYTVVCTLGISIWLSAIWGYGQPSWNNSLTRMGKL